MFSKMIECLFDDFEKIDAYSLKLHRKHNGFHWRCFLKQSLKAVWKTIFLLLLKHLGKTCCFTFFRFIHFLILAMTFIFAAVNPLSWAGPAECIDLQLRTPGLSAPYFEAPVFDPVSRPTKQARRTLPRDMYDSNMVYNQQKVKVEEPNQSRAGDYDP